MGEICRVICGNRGDCSNSQKWQSLLKFPREIEILKLDNRFHGTLLLQFRTALYCSSSSPLYTTAYFCPHLIFPFFMEYISSLIIVDELLVPHKRLKSVIKVDS